MKNPFNGKIGTFEFIRKTCIYFLASLNAGFILFGSKKNHVCEQYWTSKDTFFLKNFSGQRLKVLKSN